MRQKGNRKMAVCSFAGHKEVYDAGLASRAQAEVDRLVNEHESVEFLVYPSGGYSSVFLLAALRARTNYPEKVTITLVSRHSEAGEMTSQELAYSYISDQVMPLDLQDAKVNDPMTGDRRLLKRVVQKSTHLITYFYDTLYDADSHSMKSQKAQEVISLTTHETEEAISKAASRMTEREQLVFQKIGEGCTLKEAGKPFGIGSERVRQILQHGCRTIRGELRRRYSRAMAAEKPSAPRTCGLFALGPVSYESLTRFKHIMELLTSVYDACDIYVEQSYIPSGFLFVLTDSTCLPYRERQKIHITAIVRPDELPESDHAPDAVKEALCPLCHAVGYVSRVDSMDCEEGFDVIADMIERMDFCLCDLSSTPFAEKVREYAAKTRRTVLLDMSGHTARIDGAM